MSADGGVRELERPLPKTGFKAVVGGDYYAVSAEAKGKVARPYRVVVVLTKTEEAVAVLRKFVLPPILRKRFSDYAGIRTVYVDEMEDLSGRVQMADLHLMNLEAIKGYLTTSSARGLIDADSYASVRDLRQAIREAEQNPKAFAVNEKKLRADRELLRELKELNPEISENTEIINAGPPELEPEPGEENTDAPNI